MPLKIQAEIIPEGNFPVTSAEYIEMPDGGRLNELSIGYPIREPSNIIEPDSFYDFGEVSELSVTLAEVDDGKLHEYYFRFVPTDDFLGLNIVQDIRWAVTPQFTPGKICEISIVQNVGVLIRA